MTQPTFVQRHSVLLIELSGDAGVIGDPPAWRSGPYPFTFDHGGRATAEARATYLYPRVLGVLYDSERSRRRWHRSLEGGAEIHHALPLAIEVVRVPSSVRSHAAIAILHVELPANDPLGSLSSLVALADDASLSRAAVNGIIEDLGLEVTPDSSRATSISFITAAGWSVAPPFGTKLHASVADQWLWLFASATPPDRFRPDPEAELPPRTTLSASWRAMVLRDGLGFIGLQPDDGSDPFIRESAAAFVRSIYTDAIVIGKLQRLAFNGLADELGGLDWAAGPARLRAIEQRLSTIRNAVWGGHVTVHGIANELLRAYQDQHHLQSLVDEVHIELADAARLANVNSSRRVELLLTVLTVVSAAAGLAAVWQDHGFGVVLATAGAAATVLLLYWAFIWRR